MKRKEKNHYILSSQVRADQMPGHPREDELMYTFFLSTFNILSKTHVVILPYEGNHGITMRCLKTAVSLQGLISSWICRSCHRCARRYTLCRHTLKHTIVCMV